MTKVSRPHRPTTPPTQGAWERCVRRDPPPWLRAPPSFRATGARWDDDGARWHDPSWPLDRICENRLAPQRVCPVFWGSGPHATLVNGAKGGLATVEATGAIGRALRPGLDVLLWDHGVNDFSRVRNQLDDARRAFAWFLARAHAEFPSLAAVVVVFWQDELLALKAACDGKAAAHEGWSEQVPNALRPALVDAARRWPGTAVVTMSLPAFCRKTSERPACHPAAFTDWKTSHPTSLQNAAFADLVIWQLLPAFDATHAARCSVPLASDPPADDSVPPRASHRFHAPKLAASFFGWSPLASPPPPREDLAVLCAPGLSRAGRERRKSGKVDCVNGFNFTVFTTDMVCRKRHGGRASTSASCCGARRWTGTAARGGEYPDVATRSVLIRNTATRVRRRRSVLTAVGRPYSAAAARRGASSATPCGRACPSARRTSGCGCRRSTRVASCARRCTQRAKRGTTHPALWETPRPRPSTRWSCAS